MLAHPETLKPFIYRNKLCGASNRTMYINSKLEISPCVFFGNEYKEKERYIEGDIEKYWKKEKGQMFRKIRDISISEKYLNCTRLCKTECTATRIFFLGNTNYVVPISCCSHFCNFL